MNLIDAHNHLHHERLVPHRDGIFAALADLGVEHAVVNGTCEGDWDAVAAMAAERSFVIPSFGLHPWSVPERSSQWVERLRALLEAHADAGVGEIGLDRWIEGYDLED